MFSRKKERNKVALGITILLLQTDVVRTVKERVLMTVNYNFETMTIFYSVITLDIILSNNKIIKDHHIHKRTSAS